MADRLWRLALYFAYRAQLVYWFVFRPSEPSAHVAVWVDDKVLITRSRAIYKHLRFDLEDYMTEERGGAMRGSFYGVHAEINRIVEFPLMSMVRFEDGLIAEEWTLGNNFLVLVGLGFQLTPPGFEVIEGGTPPAEAEQVTEGER